MAARLKKLTIIDVARLARVSTTTVSRVINEGKVGKEAKERVLNVIQKYEYYPNPHVQYLGQQNHAKPIRKTGRICYVSQETGLRPGLSAGFSG